LARWAITNALDTADDQAGAWTESLPQGIRWTSNQANLLTKDTKALPYIHQSAPWGHSNQAKLLAKEMNMADQSRAL
jgi:hypothetical protein